MNSIHTLPQEETIRLLHGNDCRDFNGCPVTLRVAGSTDALLDPDRLKVAVIGTRNSQYADNEFARRIVQALSQNKRNPVILSGLAVGIDTAVHKAAMDYGLPTYAVMPLGLDEVYPRCNRLLAERMMQTGGGLISYFPDGTPPLAINFLHRNRTLAALSSLVVVVASREKGGAMVTARIAADFGIPVFALPGDIDSATRRGCNRLIRDGVAEIICDSDEFARYPF